MSRDWRNNTTVENFDGVGAFLRRLDEFPDNPGRSGKDNSDRSFHGGMNYEQAKVAAFNGDPALTKRVTELVNNIDADQYLTDAPRLFVPTVVGPIVSVPDYLAGLPDCMRQQTGQVASAQGPVTICVNRSVSAGTSNSVIERAGSAVCALALTLQRMRPVEIVIVGTLGNGNACGWGGIPIIRLGVSPFDADQLAFLLAHPAMGRMLHFQFTYGQKGYNDWIPWAWNIRPGAEMDERIRELVGAEGEWLMISGQHLTDRKLNETPELWVKDQIERLTKPAD